MWAIQIGIQVKIPKGNEINDPEEYLKFHRELQRFLSILGITVGLTTLATGGLRNALIAFGMDASFFPQTVVLAFGAYYTLLIALVYIPVYNYLMDAGRKIRDSRVPGLFSKTLDEWGTSYKVRTDLEAILQLHYTPQQQLQTAVAILAPLLSSIIALLLEVKP
jgi:hypothetical protein